MFETLISPARTTLFSGSFSLSHSALIWMMEILRFLSINHIYSVLCTALLPSLKEPSKSTGRHVKQLIWLKPSYISSYAELQQCGAMETCHPKPGSSIFHNTKVVAAAEANLELVLCVLSLQIHSRKSLHATTSTHQPPGPFQ